MPRHPRRKQKDRTPVQPAVDPAAPATVDEPAGESRPARTEVQAAGEAFCEPCNELRDIDHAGRFMEHRNHTGRLCPYSGRSA